MSRSDITIELHISNVEDSIVATLQEDFPSLIASFSDGGYDAAGTFTATPITEVDDER